MRFFKSIKRKVGNAILPVVGTILGLTILAGSVVAVALNSSKIVYRDNNLSKQNDARQILHLACKYFCEEKNNKKEDSQIVKELQEIFGLGLKVTYVDGDYYVWYPNKLNSGEKEYHEETDASGKITGTNVAEWLKAKITLTTSDADDGSGNKEAEIGDALFQEAKIDEKFSIGNLMTVYLTDEELLPGRAWKLNEISLVKSDIDTFDEAFTYMNNSGTLLVDEIGMALYAYRNASLDGTTTDFHRVGAKASDYEIVYKTSYLGGNYYWQNSSGEDSTTWIYKQEYDAEMLAGMLNFYYKRDVNKYATTDITDKRTVYYLYEESTGRHILKASSTETDDNKCMEFENTTEFAEKLAFYVFWQNMARLCLKLNEFQDKIKEDVMSKNGGKEERYYEYIWTDKGLTVNAYHYGGNYWPYFYTMSEIEEMLMNLGYSYEYMYVRPTSSGSSYSSTAPVVAGKTYTLDTSVGQSGSKGYVTEESRTYKGDSYEKDGKTYYFIRTNNGNNNYNNNTKYFFDTYRGNYITDNNTSYVFSLSQSDTNRVSAVTKEVYSSKGKVMVSKTLIGNYDSSSDNYLYINPVTIDNKTIETYYRCFDYNGLTEDYKFYSAGTTPPISYTDENGITYNIEMDNGSPKKYAKVGQLYYYGWHQGYMCVTPEDYNQYYVSLENKSFIYNDSPVDSYVTLNSSMLYTDKNISLYNSEWGAYYKYIPTEKVYIYYYIPQFCYYKVKDSTRFIYGYAQYVSREVLGIDYEKMYSRLISMKEVELSTQYAGGTRYANWGTGQNDLVNFRNSFPVDKPSASHDYYQLWCDIHDYLWEYVFEKYISPTGGMCILYDDQGHAVDSNNITDVGKIQLLEPKNGGNGYNIRYRIYFKDGDQIKDVLCDEHGNDSIIDMTLEEFKATFMTGIMNALDIDTTNITVQTQEIIKTRSKEEVMKDLVEPIRYQYLPTTKYYEIFGDNGNTLGFKEEQFYNKLLSYYFNISTECTKIANDVNSENFTYKFVRASYGTPSTIYSNKLCLDMYVDIYVGTNRVKQNMRLSFIVSPVTWNLLNTNNSINRIQDETTGEYITNYEINGKYKPIAIENMSGTALSKNDLSNKNLPAILGTLPLKARSTSSSTTPDYVKVNEKINIDGKTYEVISVDEFKAKMSSKTINITKDTLVNGNVEFLAPSSSTATDYYKDVKINVADGVSLYINGSLNLRDDEDVALGNNSLLFVNGSMFITYEYMGYLDKYDNTKTANQISSSNQFGKQTDSDYSFYAVRGVDVTAGLNAKIIINGNLDYKGYKARYTRSTSIMSDVLSTTEWNAFSRISADKILYEQSVFNANESVETNQDPETHAWSHFAKECRSKLEGIYIINGDVKFRAWDEKNTTNDISSTTSQVVAMYRNCYSNPLVNATFYVDGAFDMRGLFVSGMYDLCRANFVFAKSIIQPRISLNTIYSNKDNRTALTNSDPTADSAYAGWQNTHGYLFIICEDAVDFSVANFGCLNIFTPYAEMLAAIKNNGESDNNFTKFISQTEFLTNYPNKKVVNTWGLASLLHKGFEDMYAPNDIGSITTDDEFDSAHNIKSA